MNIKQELEANVERGMSLLDEKRPGWEWKVAPETLYLGSCLNCVLGQLTGNFWNDEASRLCGISPRIDMDQDEALRIITGVVEFGFATGGGPDKWQLLTKIWKEKIHARRAKVELPKQPLRAKCVDMALAK